MKVSDRLKYEKGNFFRILEIIKIIKNSASNTFCSKLWTPFKYKMTRMQNMFVLMNPHDSAWDVSVKGGNMILNRFCIDEDAGFELSGISCLKSTFVTREKLEEKGKEYSSCSFVFLFAF